MTGIHRNGIQCFLILLMAMGSIGCQSAGKRTTGQSSGRGPNSFGRVDPRTLHEALSPEKLAQMIQGTPLGLDDLSFLDDDYRKVTIPRPAETPAQDTIAQKAYLRGKWAMRQDDIAAAAEEFGKSLAADPNQPDVILAYAQALFALKKIDTCRAWLLHLHHLGADSVQACANLGDLYRVAEQPERAMALYDYALRQHDATEANPQTLMTNIRAGSLLAEQGYLSVAVDRYETAWQLLRRHESYSQTDRTFAQLIRQFHQPLLQLADWKLQLGDIAGTVTTLDSIQQQRSWEIIAFFIQMQTRSSLSREIRERRVEALVRYLLSEDGEAFAAIRLFNEACKQMALQSAYDGAIARWSSPESSRPALLGDRAYAYALQLADKVPEAEAILRQALNRDKRPSLELTLDLAGLLGRYDRWEEMVAVLAEHVDTLANPCEAALWEFLEQQAPRIPLQDLLSGQGMATGKEFSPGRTLVYGVLCLQKQSYELAADLLRRATQRYPDRTEFRLMLLEVLLRNQQYDQVLTVVESKTATGEPASLPTSDGLRDWYAGRAALGARKWDLARDSFQRLLQDESGGAGVWLGLTEAYVQQGDYRRAERLLHRMLDQPLPKASHPAVFPMCLFTQVNGDGSDFDGSTGAVLRELLVLYCTWNAALDPNAPAQRATAQRAQKTFQQWLAYLRKGSDQRRSSESPAWLLEPQHILESLQDRLARGRVIRLLLARTYAAQKDFAAAAGQLEPLLELRPVDREALDLAAEVHVRADQWDQAGELYLRLWQDDPDDVRKLLRAITALRQAEQAARALSILVEAVEQGHVRESAAVGQLAQEAWLLAKVSRDFAKAESVFATWRQSFSGDASETDGKKLAATLAQIHLWTIIQKSRYDRATALATELYAKYPDLPVEMGMRLARRLFWAGRPEQADALLESLEQAQPDQQAWNLEQLLQRFRSGRCEDAVAIAERLLNQQQTSDSRLSYETLLVRLQQQNDQSAQAETRLRHWLSDPNQAETSDQARLTLRGLLVDVLLRRGEFEAAEAELKTLRESVSNDDDESYREALIRSRLARGQCDELTEDIREIAENRESVELAMVQAKLLDGCGDYDEAVRLMDLALTRLKAAERPDPAARLDAMLTYSQYLDHAGRSVDSLDVLEKLHEELPDNAVVPNNLGYQLTDLGAQPDRCRTLLVQAYRMNPNSAATLDSLGWFYYKKGDYALALEYLYQAIADMAEPDAEMLDHLGDVQYRAGDPERAGFFWREALRQLEWDGIYQHPLKDRKESVEKKLQQLDAGETVTVAPLFEKIAI